MSLDNMDDRDSGFGDFPSWTPSFTKEPEIINIYTKDGHPRNLKRNIIPDTDVDLVQFTAIPPDAALSTAIPSYSVCVVPRDSILREITMDGVQPHADAFTQPNEELEKWRIPVTEFHVSEEKKLPNVSSIMGEPHRSITTSLASGQLTTDLRLPYDERRWDEIAIQERRGNERRIRRPLKQRIPATKETRLAREEIRKVRTENRDLCLRGEHSMTSKIEDVNEHVVQESRNTYIFQGQTNTGRNEGKESVSESRGQQDSAPENQLFMQRVGLSNESTAAPAAVIGVERLTRGTRVLSLPEQLTTLSRPCINLSQIETLFEHFPPELAPEAKSAVKFSEETCDPNKVELVRDGIFENDMSDGYGSQVEDAETEAENSSFNDGEVGWSSVEDLSRQRPFLNNCERRSAEEAMRTFWSLMNENWRAIIRERTGSSDDTAPTRSDSTTSRLGATTISEPASQTSLGKHKANFDDRGGDDRRPKRNTALTRLPDDATEKPQYACPYRKRNKLKYNIHTHRTCALSCFPTIARVKEHLYRTHRAPIQCPRCSLQLEDHSTLKTHLKAKTVCEDVDGEPVEGFDLDVEVKLKRRKKTSRDQTDFERWEDIYRLLFKDDEEVPSPYFEPPKDEPPPPSIPIEEYLRQEVPRRVRQHIEDRFASNNESTLSPLSSSNIMGILETEIDACIVSHRTMVTEMHQTNRSRTPPLSTLQSTSAPSHTQIASSLSSHMGSRASPSDSSTATFDSNQPLESRVISDRTLPSTVANPGDLFHPPQTHLNSGSSQAFLGVGPDSSFSFLPSSLTLLSQELDNQLDGQIQESWLPTIWSLDNNCGIKGNEDSSYGFL